MPLCLVLSDDLLDASRIAGHGRAADFDVIQCRDSTALVAALNKGPVLTLLDLHNVGLDIAEVVAALRAGGVKKVIGFGSHVDAARLKAARAAGCDEALPRSAFFEGLEAKMEEWMPRPEK